jgi:hypothetical protein
MFQASQIFYFRDLQSDNDHEEKILYMQTFRFIKVTRYHEGTNETSAYMVFFLHNHYQILYLCFSVFQLVLTIAFRFLLLDINLNWRVLLVVVLCISVCQLQINDLLIKGCFSRDEILLRDLCQFVFCLYKLNLKF